MILWQKRDNFSLFQYLFTIADIYTVTEAAVTIAAKLKMWQQYTIYLHNRNLNFSLTDRIHLADVDMYMHQQIILPATPIAVA